VRAEAVGYNVARFKARPPSLSRRRSSGLAGVLYAMLFGIVPLEAIGFVTSGNVVFATLIGGSGSLYGPVIGSFVFIWLSESVSTLWARWPLLLAWPFVIVVLFLRAASSKPGPGYGNLEQNSEQGVRRPDRRRRGEPRHRGRHAAFHHRPERRGKTTLFIFSPDPTALVRAASSSTGATSPARPPTASPSRPRALVPAHQRLPCLPLALRQRLGRGLRLRHLVEGTRAETDRYPR